MKNKPIKKETTPKDYDRWGKTCVKFDNTPNKTTKKGK